MPHAINQRILWEQTTAETAKILRIFGDSPVVSIPSRIAGYLVTELGDYCFAPNCHLPATGCLTEDFKKTSHDPSCSVQTELSGNYIQKVILPDTMRKIGDYAFYDCRNLTCIKCGCELTMIGSDAFMNCNKLNELHIRCMPSQPSGLRQMLAQISWAIEVSFYNPASYGLPVTAYAEHTKKQGAVFFPEYFETYDEIAPAHVFGRKITGEGFRARHSFKNGVIDHAQYDTIFQKACTEESEQILCRMVLCRLRYPTGLSTKVQGQYEAYIREHTSTLSRWLVSERRLDDLCFLFQEKLFSQEEAQYAIRLAAEAGWTEGSASMIRWKHILTKPSMQCSYEFDTFE